MSRELVYLGSVLGSLTFGETHSLIIGVIGFWLGRRQRSDLAAGLAIVPLVAPISENTPAGLELISSELWYFLGSLLFWYIIGNLTSPE